MRHIILTLLAAAALTLHAAPAEKYIKWASHQPNNMQVRLNIGYALGGTTPMPLPPEIRTIDKFQPYGGGNVGIEISKMFGTSKHRWGLGGGVHGFIHGMKTGAHVKGYKMAITMGDDTMSGYYTGVDETNVRIIGLTMPLKFLWRANPRWTIGAGPYLQLFKVNEFKGKVYDGYLRENTPIGTKVEIAEGTPATYDFSSDLRPANWGLAVEADWKASRHWSLYGALDWGMSGIFRHDFQTVQFKMYSIYANVGVAYNIF